MDLKPLYKAVLFHFSTKGTTVHHFVLNILFFKALSLMYLYRSNVLRYILLKFFVFLENFFSIQRLCFEFHPYYN